MSQTEKTIQNYRTLREQQGWADAIKKYLSEKYETPPLAHVHSFGCQQSVYDGERFKGVLAQLGYGFTDEIRQADLILYNTCAVRENAEQRVFGNVGALKGLKKQKPDMVIALAGCMTEQQQVSEKLKMSYPYVDLVMGSNAAGRLPELLYRVLIEGRRSIRRDAGEGGTDTTLYEEMPVLHESRFKAFVPVMYGCDNFCSYCIVPFVRGRERSRLPADVAREVKNLVENGCRDITLLGQNVNSYGKGLDEPCSFARLLRMVNDIPGDFRIRFMTSHPKDLSDDLIEAMRDCDKVCRHLHLPLQSGSSQILKVMNRHYTKEQYLELVEKIRKAVPDIALTTDIIVGFPGETEEEFDITEKYLEKVHFYEMHVFKYSRRKGTVADKMDGQVDEKIKTQRSGRLLALEKEMSAAYRKESIGKTMQVLIEEKMNYNGTDYMAGYTKNYIRVLIPASDRMTEAAVNTIVTVNCKQITEDELYIIGELS